MTGREERMPCGCRGVRSPALTQHGWVVQASSFLCAYRHNQGDVVSDAQLAEKVCAACDGDPEAHDMHVCGREAFA